MKRRTSRKPNPAQLDKFEPGGELGPLEDRNEYEQRLNSLPPEQKELRRRKHALCRSLPVLLAAEDGHSRRPSWSKSEVLPSFQLPERIRAMKNINRELMEYLNDVGQDPGIRQ